MTYIQTSKTPPISAIVLAAGFSSRMGDFKPLLPIDGATTMVEKVINLFKSNRIQEIVVVTGHNHERLEPFVKKAGGLPVFNPNFSSGMLSSIQQGVKNINPGNEGFFLLPVDICAIRASTIDLIIRQFQKTKNSIIMPCFDNTPGHPPLIPSHLKKDILGLSGNSTLRDVLLSPENSRISLKVYDRAVLMDADDKKAYQRVLKKLKNQHIPDRTECLSIINNLIPTDKDIQNHMKKVASTAMKIAGFIKGDVDTDLIFTAAMLHDIKRTQKHHAQAGAHFTQELGFTKISGIIAQHMDIEIDTAVPVQEKEIVYFADKICNGQNIELDYHTRFKESAVKFPWAEKRILKRYENTKLIQARIEESTGKSLREILA